MGYENLKMIKMNKKGLEFKSAFFAIVIMGLLIAAIGVIIGKWNVDYGSGLNYDLDEYNQMDKMSGEAQSQRGNISVRSTTDVTDFEGTSIKGVFGLLNNIYAPFRIVFGDGGMIDSVTERFGFPDYVRQVLVTLIIMSITFALMAIFFRRPGDSA